MNFVKFHWKPVLGVHSVTWDETQKISGKNSDFHREYLWEAIENRNYPEWEFGVQLIPEELVPVKIIGKMTLNKKP